MSLPEISRRCLACGAAVRAGARFCPHCGTPFEAEARSTETVEAARPAEESQLKREWTPTTKESAAARPTAEPEPVVVVEEVETEPAVLSAQSTEEGARAGDLRGRVARVREGTRARVGRMREEAIVVLEETPDDSGLRFVLVAVALFIIFLVLLFLSTTVLR